MASIVWPLEIHSVHNPLNPALHTYIKTQFSNPCARKRSLSRKKWQYHIVHKVAIAEGVLVRIMKISSAHLRFFWNSSQHCLITADKPNFSKTFLGNFKFNESRSEVWVHCLKFGVS